VVKLSKKTCPYEVDMYVKCEAFNPLSSVKDRLAIAIIEDAEKSGKLKPGDTVVEGALPHWCPPRARRASPHKRSPSPLPRPPWLYAPAPFLT
jgi:hypothetical protein